MPTEADHKADKFDADKLYPVSGKDLNSLHGLIKSDGPKVTTDTPDTMVFIDTKEGAAAYFSFVAAYLGSNVPSKLGVA